MCAIQVLIVTLVMFLWFYIYFKFHNQSSFILSNIFWLNKINLMQPY